MSSRMLMPILRSSSSNRIKSPYFITRTLSTKPLSSKQQRVSKQQSEVTDKSPSDSAKESSSPHKVKTVSQADAELRERLEKMSGEGGAAGIEYEDGRPNAMKRSVRNNMFRLI